jgi:hypothetical protein
MYLEEYLDLESLPCLLLMLNHILYHEAFYLADNTRALIRDNESIQNGWLVL